MTATFAYDAEGRRVRAEHTNGIDLCFLHAPGAGDLAHEIAEIDCESGSGSYGKILRRYVPGVNVDERVAMPVLGLAEGKTRGITTVASTGATASREYYHADRQGNIIAMADAAGNRTAQYVYSPFGVEEPLNTSGNPFRYTGRRAEPPFGLYYYRARYYSPDLGRFLETDPIGFADQMNLYAYVGNDPLNAMDPTGMYSEAMMRAALTRAGGRALVSGVVSQLDSPAPGPADIVAGGLLLGTGAALLWDVSAAILANEEGPRIHEGRQGKHQPGHRNFDDERSPVTHPDPQGLVDEHAGTGEQVGETSVGEPGSKERVDFGEPIGAHVDRGTGERSETTRGIIHYGKEGVHIVPARPNPPEEQQ